MVIMEKVEQRDREKIDAVLRTLKKQTPLTVKQEKYCNDACVERFLKAKGDSVKKAAKHLRAALSWRDAVGTDELIADEFSAELAEGVTYVAGHDVESRPVVIFRIKQDYPKSLSQKSFVRLLVFTFEVAISSMSRFVDQMVLIFDASFFRSASAFLNLVMGTLKLLADYYPGRLHRAFVVDPPSLFPYLWKGVRPFLDLSSATSTVSSLDFDDDSPDDGGFSFAAHPRTASLRFDRKPYAATIKQQVGSTSSRFSFTVSHMDALKPWYLSTTTATTTARSSVVPTASPSLVGVSPLSARSHSFASPGGRSMPLGGRSMPSTPKEAQQKGQRQAPRTPRPSFLQSPAAALFGTLRKETSAGGQQQGLMSRAERERAAFLPYLRLYRRPYDEVVYRGKMLPPLGGLIAIVNTAKQQQRHRHVSSQQCYYHKQRM